MYTYRSKRHLSSAVLVVGAEGAPVFPEKAATCFFTAAKPLLPCRDPISVCAKNEHTACGGGKRAGKKKNEQEHEVRMEKRFQPQMYNLHNSFHFVSGCGMDVFFLQ